MHIVQLCLLFFIVLRCGSRGNRGGQLWLDSEMVMLLFIAQGDVSNRCDEEPWCHGIVIGYFFRFWLVFLQVRSVLIL